MSQKYKEKFKRIKHLVKTYSMENSALCDEIWSVQSDLLFSQAERQYLIQRLIFHEGVQKNLFVSDNVGNSQKVSESKSVSKNRVDRKDTEGVVTAINPVLKKNELVPLMLKNLIIQSIGEIVPVNPKFHTIDWIYPVGYVATRTYAHPKYPYKKCKYTCKILNNGGAPQFQLIPDNELDSVFFGDSANICHRSLLENLRRNLPNIKNLNLKVQGEVFFGLAAPGLQTILKADPAFKECSNFNQFKVECCEDTDPSISFEALQSLISLSSFCPIPEVKREPPDELLNVF